MSYQCKKCNHPAFLTSEKLKNHSRTHAATCNVKFPVDGGGLQEEGILHRADTGIFQCSRCLVFTSKRPLRMQVHCRTCKEVNCTINVEGPAANVSTSLHPFLLANGGGGSYMESELYFFVNEHLHVAICRPCQYIVEAESIGQHVSRVHRRKVDPTRLALDIDRFSLRLGKACIAPYRVATRALKDPIEGLQVLDGFRCKLCTFSCQKLATFKGHFRNAHHSNWSLPENREACYVQRLSPSPGSNTWFAVHHVSETGVPCNSLIDIVTREAHSHREEALAATYSDVRHLPLFIKRLGWDSFIQNLGGNLGAMALLVSPPASDDDIFFVNRLHDVLRSLMADFQDNNGTAEVLLRRKVKSAKANDISPAPFSRLDQSCEDYVATLLHLIILLLRALNNDDNNDEENALLSTLVPLYEPLRQSLQSLWIGLQMEEGDGNFGDEQIRISKWHCIRVLEDLFFIQRPSHLVPESTLLVYRFVAFVAIEQRRVVAPDDATHRISRMMYWCRSLVLHKIIHTPFLEMDNADEIEEQFLLFVRHGHRTPFSAILEAKRLIFSITRNEIPLPKVVWDGNGQLIDGVVVDIEGISAMIHQAIKELYHDFERDIILGMPTYHSNKNRLLKSKSGGALQDNLRDNRVGYWFISNPNNHCSDYTLSLIHHIVGDDILCRQFVDRIDEVEKKIIWNRDTLSNWMHKVGKWLQKLLSIAHVIAGQPGRGVEFLSCAIRNTSAQIRGVYFVGGLLMLLSLYGKADGLRGVQRPVARYLCKDTSFLLTSYLTYVREMEKLASRVLYTTDQTSLYNQFLAMKEGRALSSRDLSEGVSRLFLAHFNVAVSLNSWRHMAIAWMHRFMKYAQDSELSCNGPLDSQAGHSQQIASRVYGRSNFDHPSIGRDEFQLYRLASVEWHKLLHLASDGLPPYEAIRDQNGVGTTLLTTTSHVHHHHHHAIKVVQAAGDIATDLPSLTCSELAIQGLALLGYDKFKSSHQALAIHRILSRQEDLLVILPTGGGKTLLFLLPALVERGRYTTVVVCPFVALKKEMRHCLEKAGMSIEVYSGLTAVGGVDILLVSVEQCLEQAFQNHLGCLHGEGRLARIVVDECHLAIVASSWRPAMRDMEHLRKVPVPLLLLSATIPPNMEDPLRRLFISQLSIVRSSTTRSNITYQVVKDHGPLDATLVRLLLSGPITPKSIIFTRGREDTGILAALLRSHGLTAVNYHGHLDETSKTAAQDSWMRGDVDIMVATGAFGAGIDFGAVRLIVHMDEPYSMIDLAQESGRGGRDGLPSKHIILLPTSWQARAETCTNLVDFLSGIKCRRSVLQEYMDGCRLDCFSSGSEQCDVCESITTRVQSRNMAATPSSGSAPTRTNLVDDDIDLFADMDEDALAALEERPTKRISVGNVLLSGSTKDTQERHGSQSLTFLNLAQFLKGAKQECILCVINGRRNCHHPISQCPYVRHLCFKCLANCHGSSNCQNRLQWRGKQCFGCGLPSVLGQQVMHPERFGSGCKSIGEDKVVPACWWFWRDVGRFRDLQETSGCNMCSNDHEFAKWLTSPNTEFQSNAIYLLTLYVNSLQ